MVPDWRLVASNLNDVGSCQGAYPENLMEMEYSAKLQPPLTCLETFQMHLAYIWDLEDTKGS